MRVRETLCYRRQETGGGGWCGWRDSNPRPSVPQVHSTVDVYGHILDLDRQSAARAMGLLLWGDIGDMSV
jgi:hypothetical protein